MEEQGWSKAETIEALVRKAGWVGDPTHVERTYRLIRYQCTYSAADYELWSHTKSGVRGIEVTST